MSLLFSFLSYCDAFDLSREFTETEKHKMSLTDKNNILLAVFGFLFVVTFSLIYCPESFADSSSSKASASDPKPTQQDTETFECMAPGHAALENGDLNAAKRVFEDCAKKFPAASFARYWLGMVYFFAHDADKATAEFKEVVRLEPSNPLGLAMLGRMYSFDQTKLNLAKELLERSLAQKPDADDARFDLARVYAQLGDHEKSMKEFGIIMEGESKFALYRTELAKVLLSLGQKDEAKKSLDKALVLDPQFEPAKKLLNEIK